MEKKGFIYKNTDTSENKVKFNIDPGGKKNWEVKVFDRNDDQVKEYDYIKTDGRVIITLEFQWEREFGEVGEENVEYLLKRTDYWEPTKNGGAEIKAGKRIEFNKLVKDAHKKLLKECFGEKLFGTGKRELVTGSENLEFNITEDKDKGTITANFFLKDDTSSTPRSFSEDQIHIKPIYYSTKGIAYEEADRVNEKAEEKSKLTTGWKIFFVVLAIAAILVVVFWKKIWKWFKGEREQERKVREQLDIF